jgi:hypothetical protein
VDGHDDPTVEKEHSPMAQQRAPRVLLAQELLALLQGPTHAHTGEE